MVKVGILGAAGYTGGELIRLLINHPEAEIVFANSESNAGNLVAEVHEGLYGETDLKFTAEMPFDQVDVIFFCFGHGKSEAFLKEHNVPENVKIIDLAQDFRLAPETVVATQQPTPAAHDFVYGLPEINESKIAVAQHVANPGCFATCIQLGLLPAAKMGLINSDVSVNAITGSTGAGQTRCHYPFLMAQQQHEHLQGIQPSARARDSSESEADTGLSRCSHRLHPLPWRLRPRYLRYRSCEDRQAYRGNRGRLQGVLQGCQVYSLCG